MSRRGRHSRRISATRATIDMNSLIDLTFLLLVTFILTITQMQKKQKYEQSNISINLPGAQADENAETPKKDTTITVRKKKEEGEKEAVDLFFNDREISPGDLAKKLEEQVREEEAKKLQGIEEDAPVYVRGDNDVRYEDMMKVMEIVRKAGVKRMAFVTVKE